MKRIGNFLFFNVEYGDGSTDSGAVAIASIDGALIKHVDGSGRKLLIYASNETCVIAGDADENIIAFAKAVEDWE